MIKKTILAAAVLAMGLPAWAQTTSYQQQNDGAHGTKGTLIHVSCYRGPWKDVIWDHPDAVFVDSLVDVGYDYTTANAIAERVCRDKNLVGNLPALKAEMERIARDPRSRRNVNY